MSVLRKGLQTMPERILSCFVSLPLRCSGIRATGATGTSKQAVPWSNFEVLRCFESITSFQACCPAATAAGRAYGHFNRSAGRAFDDQAPSLEV